MYDPGYTNTAVAKSKICEIKGSKGELSYRGYDIIELVQNSTFLEVAYLLIYGKMPDKEQLGTWVENVMHHSFVHTDLLKLLGTFRYNAHPMSMLISYVSESHLQSHSVENLNSRLFPSSNLTALFPLWDHSILRPTLL
jgi:citrate synthase